MVSVKTRMLRAGVGVAMTTMLLLVQAAVLLSMVTK